jgi:hypothetical protein
MPEESEGQSSVEPADDERISDTATRWLVILIVAPVLIIATGYLVSLPIGLALAAVHFDAASHPVIAVLVVVARLALWVVCSAALIRMVWPKRRLQR